MKRSLSSLFLIGALSSLLVAGACRSDNKSSAKKETRAGELAGGSSTSAGTPDERPTIPTPRRMRGDDEAEVGDDEADDTRRRWRERRRDGEDGERSEAWERRRERMLDPEARAEMRRERMGRMVESLDSDGDGKLSRAEFDASPERTRRMLGDFDALDTDGDCFVSAEEIEAAVGQRAQRRRIRGDRDPERFRERRERGDRGDR
jgi:hypothetical protein